METSLPTTLDLRQNASATLPGTGEELSIAIGDITRGTVTVNVKRKDGRSVLGPDPMKRGDTQVFQAADRTYSLKLAKITDTMAGDDTASFIFAEVSAEALAEKKKIEQLIAAVEGLNDAVFIRNGTEYKAKDAADHLRRKLEAAGDEIDSATKFINLIASKSSMSGEEYTIRFADGRIVTAGDFLREKLSTLESANGAG
ncbi:MAG: DUF5329 family protein [Candidatus Hydrogenedentes bacterium]|nr:DUF5329 family protein [Candidatus Hydrogenedentota bacterium]